LAEQKELRFNYTPMWVLAGFSCGKRYA